ncbi:MAG TPA: hypothetical protein VKA21_06875 [Candidatus Binatia bacterium]|nr:hypothetical protein [Candidatus Binatia bacterium]
MTVRQTARERRGGSRWRAAAGAIVAALVLGGFYLASYGDCVDDFFYLDDFALMGQASHVRTLADWPLFFVPAKTFLLYRPACVMYFSLLHRVFGYDAIGYHAVHLGLHVATGLVVYGLAARLLASRPLGLATALLYATAPGHAIAACWIALCTMTATAFFYLLGLVCWLGRGTARWRWWATLACFVLAVLSSEHGVTFPVALTAAAVLLEPGRTWRAVAREQAPFYALALAYGTAKLVYVFFIFPHALTPDERTFIRWAYGTTFAPAAVLLNLGRYLGHALDLAHGLATAPGPALAAAGVVLVAAAGTTLLALRPGVPATIRIVAFGLDLFVIALGPVLILREHLFSYYVGTATEGLALALVGLARALPGVRRLAPAALVVAALATHVFVTARSVREGGEFGMYRGFARQAATWLRTVSQRVAGAHVAEVVVPEEPVTRVVFEIGEAHRLLLCADWAVTTSTAIDGVAAAPERVVVRTPDPPLPEDEASPRTWPWLRAHCPSPPS